MVKKTDNIVVMKMLSLLLLTHIICSLFSCQNATNQKIIPPEKMESVLKDIMLLETYYQSKYGSPTVYGKSLKKATQKIFEKHQVTEKQYTSSFDYYASHPLELKAIQGGIIEQLNRENK